MDAVRLLRSVESIAAAQDMLYSVATAPFGVGVAVALAHV